MNRKVKSVMDYIHYVACYELQGDQYIEFLERIRSELEQELEECNWPDAGTDE